MKITGLKCDMCDTVEYAESVYNKWRTALFGEIEITICEGYIDNIVIDLSVNHLCGSECAIKLVSQWLTRRK